LTEKITGCAYKAFNRINHGFLESVYGKWLLLKLRKSGLDVVPQKTAVYGLKLEIRKLKSKVK